MIYCSEIKVRGYHLDFYGHVNNARYLEFLEEARWALFEDRVNLSRWQEQGIAFVIVNININFRKSAGLGDTLEILSGVSRMSGKSGTIHQEIMLKGYDTVVADADIIFVLTDVLSGKALPLEGEFRTLFEQLN